MPYYLHNWMKGLTDTRKLVELCLPGSHDAGVYMDKDKGVTPGDSARCQYKNIYEQARDGSRVFDIRCFLDGKTPKMGHFFKDQPGVGDWGGTLESALDDAVKFLEPYPGQNPSEFLIFRIGHTKCTGEVAEVLNTTDPKTYKTKYQSFILKGNRGNLANLQVKDLRGKLLLIFDEEFLGSGDFKIGDGYYPYVKHPNPPANGLSFCGKYSGDPGTLLSVWTDQGNWSAKGAKNVALAGSNEHKDHKPPDDHLFWVYWQQTGGNVEKNTKAADGMHLRLENFLHRFKVPNNKLRLPNVIGHDFVNRFTCSRIAKMNMDVDTQLERYPWD